jgi:hypothetical protein
LANAVWHRNVQILLDLTRDDLNHPEFPGLWGLIYDTDRFYGRRGVPVSERDLLCGGVCHGSPPGTVRTLLDESSETCLGEAGAEGASDVLTAPAPSAVVPRR